MAASSSTTLTGVTRRFRAARPHPASFNTIALLDSDGLATKNFANIAQVLMSWDQMNPEYITKTGHIKLTDENSEILRGYLTVLDYKVSDGRNVAFQVMPGKYGGNTSEIGYGKRLSLTFNGVLFGTYEEVEPIMTPTSPSKRAPPSPTTPPASPTPTRAASGWPLVGQRLMVSSSAK